LDSYFRKESKCSPKDVAFFFTAVSVDHIKDVCAQAEVWGRIFQRVFSRSSQSYESGLKSKVKKGTPRGAILTILTRLHIPYKSTKKRSRNQANGHVYTIDRKAFGTFAHMVDLYDGQFLTILAQAGVPNTEPHVQPAPPFFAG
jgi:hypothetical protein